MRHYTDRRPFLLAGALCLLAQACSESVPRLQAPMLAKGGQPSDLPAVFALADRTDPASAVVNDGRDGNSDGASDAYVDGLCGVSATVYEGTAYLDPDRFTISRKQASSCGGQGPRYIELRFANLAAGAGVPEAVQTPGIMKLTDILTVSVGLTEARGGVINNGKCGLLAFTGEGGSSLLEVFRARQDSFVVTSAGPSDLGYCRSEVSLWHMPFQAVVVLK